MIDGLTAGQVIQLTAITDAILERLNPFGTMATTHQRYDRPSERASRKRTSPRK